MKIVISAFVLLASCVVFGAADDMVLSFSTSGVDRYADGTRVKDGESYALVWTAEGAAIRLEVKGMSEAADYFVVPGDTPGSFASAMDAKADAEGFTFEKPETPAAFYKVIGVRKFD